MSQPVPNPLTLSDRITILPVVHGSAECAIAVRRWLLENPIDCLAIPLPPSFGPLIEQSITWLPTPSIVFQQPFVESLHSESQEEWQSSYENESSEFDSNEEKVDWSQQPPWSYVPIDPCQPVIMAIRTALGEHLAIEYVDRESSVYQQEQWSLPDPYALKQVSLARFATAVLPSIPRPRLTQTIDSIANMAKRLKRLEKRYKRIALICALPQWPWIREAYQQSEETEIEGEPVYDPQVLGVDSKSLTFLFGELPFITALHEKARNELEDDEELSIDGIKQLLMTARSNYEKDFGSRGRKITPQLLSQCLKFTRNLTLMDRRITPRPLYDRNGRSWSRW